MLNSFTESIQTSADHLHIDVALKSLWQPFNDLVAEMDSFIPRPLTDFATERQIQLDHFRRMNPNHPVESLTKLVDDRISLAASERVQFADSFSNRFMTQYVMVAFLSHALCEAVINAILAIGLTQAGAHDLFSVLEKADIKEKWRVGPKSFSPDYELKSDTAIFETLNHLTKQRNALVHYKVHLHVGDKKMLEGSKFERLSFQDDIRWMRRFFSLPYDLSTHANLQLRGLAIFALHGSSPIVKADAH